MRITRESVERFNRFTKLLLGGEAILEYGFGNVLQGDTSEKFDPTLKRGGVNQLHPYSFESGFAKQPRKPWADIGIGPTT